MATFAACDGDVGVVAVAQVCKKSCVNLEHITLCSCHQHWHNRSGFSSKISFLNLKFAFKCNVHNSRWPPCLKSLENSSIYAYEPKECEMRPTMCVTSMWFGELRTQNRFQNSKTALHSLSSLARPRARGSLDGRLLRGRVSEHGGMTLSCACVSVSRWVFIWPPCSRTCLRTPTS